MNYPRPKKIPIVIERHGDRRVDYYYWMRNRDDPDVMKLIEEENRFIDELSKNFKNLEEELFNEFLGRLEEEDTSYPYKYKNYYYFFRTFKGKSYRAYYRKNELGETLLLDLNELARDYNYFALGCFEISEDEKFLAFSYDINGSENYKLFVKNLENGEITFISENTDDSCVWFNGCLFFIIRKEDTLRPYKVVKFDLNSLKSEEIFTENDEAYYVNLYKSRDENYLFIRTSSLDNNEIYFIDKNFKLNLFKQRKKGVKYALGHNNGYFYILTNEFNKNFEIYRCKVNDLSNLEQIIKYRENTEIKGFRMFKDFLAIMELDIDKAIKRIEILDLESKELHCITFPDPNYNIELIDNYEFETDLLRIRYESLIQPPTIYDYDVKNRKLILRKQQKVNNFDRNLYKIEMLYKDGIPITLAYRKDLFKKDGSNYLIAYGYGAYGFSYFPLFSIPIISLLDRGLVYSIIHVRGGGEKGEKWHEEGKLLNKKNTIYDFIKCCEFLIENKYTDKNKIVVSGGSAGGILVGGVINERPELFRVAIANVPFVDVLNTMLDPSLPLTVNEYDEWGNPEVEEFYYYIKSYSPYDNIKEQAYPNILATAGLNDPRVGYWEPLKWISKLREYNKSNNVIAIKIDTSSGHGYGEDRYKFLRERAFIYAFAIYFCK